MKAARRADWALFCGESKPNGFSGIQHHFSKYLSQWIKVPFEFGLEGIEPWSLSPVALGDLMRLPSGGRP